MRRYFVSCPKSFFSALAFAWDLVFLGHKCYRDRDHQLIITYEGDL